MGKLINLTGKRFGRLTIIERVQNNKYNKPQWLCRCMCNNKTIVSGHDLKNNNTKSCGCLRKTHGYSGCQQNITYVTWYNMIQRCTNSNRKDYEYYGRRGIKVCDKWLSFESFLEDMGEKPKGLSLDKVDNNKGYCKANCRWVTRKEQQRNRRNNILITIDNITKCLAEWCEEFNLKYSKIKDRIKRYGWTPEEALELVLRRKNG